MPGAKAVCHAAAARRRLDAIRADTNGEGEPICDDEYSVGGHAYEVLWRPASERPICPDGRGLGAGRSLLALLASSEYASAVL